eukprot:Nitzschia sp. Nitz4//scaffold44_size153857//40530//42087//NITZ4_002708-RA/size153857-snap-gene-0.208-mRNA-1//-1//CDS//3329552118//5315//frame0
MAGLSPNRFPETQEEATKAEDALTQELNKLSLAEHEKIIFEVHGFSSGAASEDPSDLNGNGETNMESNIEKLRQKLASISPKDAYDQALQQNPTYVQDSRFLQMFLRAELYDIDAAAEAIVDHFDVKRRIFHNPDVLGRDVRWSDLSVEDIAILKEGNFQLFPSRDAAGRIVIVENYPKVIVKHELASPMSRALWYFHMTLARDEESQTKGIIFVVYNWTGLREELDPDDKAIQVRTVIPHRLDAGHYCYRDPNLHSFVTGIQLFTPDHVRFRFRPHLGNLEQVHFKLQTFGIPIAESPKQSEESWSLEWHHEWLESRRKYDEEMLKLEKHQQSALEKQTTMRGNLILIPRKFDVLFGRGKGSRTHTGNLRAMHLCEMHRDEYEATGKFRKTELAERIVSIIQSSNGRFLQLANGGWTEVDNETARDKIAHFFRHKRAKTKEASSDDVTDAKTSETSSPSQPSPTTVTTLERDCAGETNNASTTKVQRVTPPLH